MNPTELPIRDLHLPALTGMWPLAPGWWVLILLALGAILWLLHNLARRHAQGAARRHALRQLEVFERAYLKHGNAVAFGTQLSELVRRTMLAYAPRAEVAGLTGDAWLAWLDRDMEAPQFLKGDGRALISVPYQDASTQLDQSQVAVLVDAVRLRLKTPVAESRRC